MLIIQSPGIFSSVQDLGREGVRQDGISQSGALDPLSLQLANRLVGNTMDAAAIEIMLGQFQVRFEQAGWIALTGADCFASLDSQTVYCGWRVPVRAGQVLSLKVARSGLCAYLAVAGGIDVPVLMGSRATDIQAGLGGYQGRALQTGDQLPVIQDRTQIQRQRDWTSMGILLPRPSPQLRCVPGPEWGQFTPVAQHYFVRGSWQVTPTSNRMGFRLKGDTLALQEPLNLPQSDVLSGVIQVLPCGQPIILGAECQTSSEYPRIGVIIRSDVWKLGQLRPGQYVYFNIVSETEAEQAAHTLQKYLRRVDLLLQRTQETACDALI